jgi:N-acetylmuramoyl-L-alanine amidase
MERIHLLFIQAFAGFLICASGSPLICATTPFVVVVDAGHGGRDPGSISSLQSRRFEKTVTLAIARATYKKLYKNRSIRIVLTRSDDRFLSLVQRRQVAERERADLFISIHADSATDHQARGASVYTLTEDGRAIVVSRMATATSLNGQKLTGIDHDTAAVLVDLQQRSAMNKSALFTARLANALSHVVIVRKHFHNLSQFAVLKARGIPAILIETGYVTNRDDTKILFSSSGQKRIANAIARTILETVHNTEPM